MRSPRLRHGLDRVWQVPAGVLVLLLLVFAGLVAPVSAAAPPAGAQQVQAVARPGSKPPATLAVTQRTGANGRVRLKVSSNAKKVVVVYRTAGGRNKKITARLARGEVRLTLPAGATGILAQTMSTSRLAKSALVVPTPARYPTLAPRGGSPGPVAGPVFTARSGTSVTLGWTNPPDRDLQAIVILQSANARPPLGQAWDHVFVLPATASSFVDEGLASNTTYHYVIFTVDWALHVGPNYKLSITLPDTTPPAPVTALTAGAITRHTVELNWVGPPPVSDLASVQIRRATGAVPPATVADGTLVTTQAWSATPQFTDSGLQAATQYSYSAFALDTHNNPSAPTSLTTTTASWVKITAGTDHTCALDTHGAAWCWGRNTESQLGDGSNIDRSTPVAVAGGHIFTSIAAGGNTTCALDTVGAAWCWGSNDLGQLGIGTNDNSRSVPAAVTGGHTFAMLAGGGSHNCALQQSGTAWCWGGNTQRELGDGSEIWSSTTPVVVTGGHTFTSLAAGMNRTCGLDSARAAWCWGFDDSSGTYVRSNTPLAVPGGHSFTAIATGWLNSCAIDESGAAWCWCQNGGGAIQQGFTCGPNPVVIGGHIFTAVTTPGMNTCALDSAGAAWCWGGNWSGRLGDGTTETRTNPVAVLGEHTFKDLTAGEGQTCGVDNAGTAWCWGANRFGQLGDGTFDVRTTPVAVK